MTQRLEIWYIESVYGEYCSIEYFFYSEKNFRFCGKKIYCYKKRHGELFPFEIDFYHEGLFGKYLLILLFIIYKLEF